MFDNPQIIIFIQPGVKPFVFKIKLSNLSFSCQTHLHISKSVLKNPLRDSGLCFQLPGSEETGFLRGVETRKPPFWTSRRARVLNIILSPPIRGLIINITQTIRVTGR